MSTLKLIVAVLKLASELFAFFSRTRPAMQADKDLADKKARHRAQLDEMSR